MERDWKSVIKIGNAVVASFILIATIVSIFLPVFDLNVHFQDYLVHFLLFLVFSGLAGLIINSKTILYTSFGCAAALALFLKNASNAELKNPKPNNRDKITVAHINLSLITEVETVQKLVQDSTIDLISIQEYTPDWAAIIPHLIKSKFPFAFENVRMDLYGKAIFSKRSFYKKNIQENSFVSNMEAEVTVGQETFSILSTYLVPALDGKSKDLAKIQLGFLRDNILSADKTRIIMGEFNQVYWSHDIIGFRSKTGLLNSRRNILPYTFKMPYNHIFYSSNLECFYFDELQDISGEYIGSKSSFQLKNYKTRKYN